MAHATEVYAVMEAENKKTARRREDVRPVRSAEEDLPEEARKVKG